MFQTEPQNATGSNRVGPYSRPHTLAKLDQRTKEARLVREVRAELTAHLGGKPSAAQRMLIERIATLQLQLALMERDLAAKGRVTERDSRQFLAWNNALSRLLRQLGLKSASPERGPSLSDILRNHAANAPVPPTSRAQAAPSAAAGQREPGSAEPACNEQDRR